VPVVFRHYLTEQDGKCKILSNGKTPQSIAGLRGLNLFYMTGYVEAGILTSAAFSMPSFSEGEQNYLLCPPPSFWGII
jgi:hypothetical protein